MNCQLADSERDTISRSDAQGEVYEEMSCTLELLECTSRAVIVSVKPYGD